MNVSWSWVIIKAWLAITSIRMVVGAAMLAGIVYLIVQF